MYRALTACVAGLVLAAAGCGDSDTAEAPGRVETEPYEDLAIAADTAESFTTDNPVGVLAVQGGDVVGGPLTATGNFRGQVEGSTPGAVTVTEVEGGTDLLVTLDGYEPDSDLQVVLARGVCGETAEAIHVVEPVMQVGSAGVANLEATIDQPIRPLFDGAHSIRLLNPQDSDAATLPAEATQACADLPELE
ncbi:MAG: hypothetical protein WD737_14335 [Gemmatimonadota bacterium]